MVRNVRQGSAPTRADADLESVARFCALPLACTCPGAADLVPPDVMTVCRQPWPEQEDDSGAQADLLMPGGKYGVQGRGGQQRTTVSDVAPAAALAEVALAKPLLSLSLEGNYLGDKGVACLASALAAAAPDSAFSLTSLNLSSNNSVAGSQQRTFNTAAAALGRLLNGCTTLSSLDLCRNGIRDEGACAVARGLRSNTSLQTLRLGWNSFGSSRAMKEVRNGLVVAGLIELDLGYNSITAKTAHILAEALALNTSLRSLVVDGNILNRSGAMVCLFPSFCARTLLCPPLVLLVGGVSLAHLLGLESLAGCAFVCIRPDHL